MRINYVRNIDKHIFIVVSFFLRNSPCMEDKSDMIFKRKSRKPWKVVYKDFLLSYFFFVSPNKHQSRS